MKTIIIFLALIAIFCVGTSYAQSFHYDTIPAPGNQPSQLYRLNQPGQQPSPPSNESVHSGFDKSHLVLGGSFGMVFGDYTAINIAPQIGYAFNKYITAGGGISYNYYKYSSYDQSQNYLGLNVYGRLNPIPYIALQVQPEGYYMWGNFSEHTESKFVPCMLIGGGVVLPAGRGGVSVMLYYDVVQYKSNGINYSPYGNQLVYSIGYVFGF